MAKRGFTLMCRKVKDDFLRALEQGLSVKDAARSVGYNWPTSLQKEKKKDEKFAEAWAEAAAIGHEARCDAAEAEVFRRGIEGFDEETWTRGPDGRMRVQKRVRQKDTRSLLAYLGAYRPEKWSGKRPEDRPQIQVSVEKIALEFQPLAARLLGAQPAGQLAPPEVIDVEVS